MTLCQSGHGRMRKELWVTMTKWVDMLSIFTSSAFSDSRGCVTGRNRRYSTRLTAGQEKKGTYVFQIFGVMLLTPIDFQLACRLGFLQRLPCPADISIWLMQQVQIDIVHIELAQRCFDALLCGLIAIVLQPQLARDKDLLSRIPFSNGPADIGFIEIRRSGIDMPVAGLKCLQTAS